jgi:hypothetical protein
MPVQLWEVEFSGSYNGAINLVFGYDATLLPAGFDQSTLAIFHWSGGAWVQLPAMVDPVLHTIAFSTTSLGTFALGTAGGVEYAITVSVAPANSGTVTGGGTYASGADVTLTAAPNAGYYFANWSEERKRRQSFLRVLHSPPAPIARSSRTSSRLAPRGLFRPVRLHRMAAPRAAMARIPAARRRPSSRRQIQATSFPNGSRRRHRQQCAHLYI